MVKRIKVLLYENQTKEIDQNTFVYGVRKKKLL